MTPLATIDLVGWDIHRAIVDNIYELAPDEAHETLRLPQYMADLMEKGVLGRKTGGGFFGKDDGGSRIVLDPKTQKYTPKSAIPRPDLAFIDTISNLHRIGRYVDGMKAFAEATGPYAAIAQKVIAGYIAYSFNRVGEVTDDISGIDRIMGYGFNWAPPSVLVDTIGLKPAIQMIEKAGLDVPPALANAQEGTKFCSRSLRSRRLSNRLCPQLQQGEEALRRDDARSGARRAREDSNRAE